MASKTRQRKAARKNKPNKLNPPETEFERNGHPQATGTTDRPPWDAWVNNLQDRRRPKRISRLFNDRQGSPLLWSVTDEVVQSDAVEIIGAAHRLVLNGDHGSRAALLDRVSGDIPACAAGDPQSALEWIAIIWALPQLAPVVDENTWWRIIDEACELATGQSTNLHDDPWAYQLAHVELPLTLAYQMPELSRCRQLEPEAAASFTRSVHELLDGDGWPQAKLERLFRPLLACWVRSWMLARARKLDVLAEDEALQLEWFIRQSLRLLRADGSQMLVDGSSGAWNRDLFQAAVEISNDKEDRRIAQVVLPKQAKSKSKGRPLPEEPSGISEWAGLGVLRSTWERGAPKLAVSFTLGELKFELSTTQPLLSGDQPPQMASQNRDLAITDEWEVVCWHSDDDVEYLELEADLTNGIVLQRQFLLAREDEFLFVADAVIPPAKQTLSYRYTLSTPGGIDVLPETETNEVYLTDGKIRALVLPLAVGEWKSRGVDGGFHLDSGTLTLQLQSVGSGLYVPWFVDLNQRRSRRPRTWRQLTVAEWLHPVPPDVATAFRVQVGRDQWVFYRSLNSPGNRTFLGQNVSCEFFAGRFESDGETKELLAIE